jgi:hypothetical protein
VGASASQRTAADSTASASQALTDGILEAAVLCRYEVAVRPEALRWKDWLEGQKHKIRGGLDVLEAEAGSWGEDFDIGQIGAACVGSFNVSATFEPTISRNGSASSSSSGAKASPRRSSGRSVGGCQARTPRTQTSGDSSTSRQNR